MIWQMYQSFKHVFPFDSTSVETTLMLQQHLSVCFVFCIFNYCVIVKIMIKTFFCFLTSSSMSLGSDDDIQKRRFILKIVNVFWSLACRLTSASPWNLFLNLLWFPCHYNWFMVIIILKYQFLGFDNDTQNKHSFWKLVMSMGHWHWHGDSF